MDLWYAVRTKPRQEFRAQENLKRQGFCTYFPLLQPAGRRKRTEPLFPGYLFLQEKPLQEESLQGEPLQGESLQGESLQGESLQGESSEVFRLPWEKVRSTRGVLCFVRFGPEPARLEGTVVNAIREREKLMEKSPPGFFKHGQAVSFVDDGSLNGLQGVYLCDKGEERCVILLNFLNRTQKVVVPQASLC